MKGSVTMSEFLSGIFKAVKWKGAHDSMVCIAIWCAEFGWLNTPGSCQIKVLMRGRWAIALWAIHGPAPAGACGGAYCSRQYVTKTPGAFLHERSEPSVKTMDGFHSPTAAGSESLMSAK
ncbi:hypothetical protein ACQUQU_03140 [Thalassolituus sp. LLYu03]|uniref:hypothetical protein n=1 Tax=Thalassolituus sp. LLYu03 TaxID=3421656 RepID=UPI003D29C41D